jgi:hypothetical protein
MTSMRVLASSRQWLAMKGPPAGLAQPRLHHRVAAGLDVDAGVGHELGPAPAQRGRALGQRGQRVQLASARASADSAAGALQRVQQLLVQPLLARQRALLRRQRLVLEGLQLGRDEALGVLQRLPALVVGGTLSRPEAVTSM